MTTAIAKIEKNPIAFRDTHGNQWEAMPGQFNGIFQVAGDPEKNQFSVKSFVEFLKKHVARLRSDGPITEAGVILFEDFFQKPTTKNQPKEKSQPTNADKVLEYLKAKGAPTTKKTVAQDTKISGLDFAIAKLKKEGKITVAGKDGNSPLYKAV